MKIFPAHFLFLGLALSFQPFFSFSQSTITTDSVIQTGFCPGQSLIITFTTDIPLSFNTKYYAEMSDGSGNFDNPDTIGQSVLPILHIILGTVSPDATFGINYRIRVVSSDPEVIGSVSPNFIVIFAIPGLRNISASPDFPICEPGTVTLTGGFGGSSYAWSNGGTGQSITVSESGNYVCTVTDIAGCNYVSDALPVTIYSAPIPVITLTDGIFSSTSASSYQWYLDGDSIPGATSQTFGPSAAGNYSVVTISSKGCTSISEPYLITDHNDLLVYPNPFSGSFTIDAGFLADEYFGYAVYTQFGQKIAERIRKKISGPMIQFIEADWETGIYFLEVNFGGNVQHFTLVKL